MIKRRGAPLIHTDQEGFRTTGQRDRDPHAVPAIHEPAKGRLLVGRRVLLQRR